MTTMPTLTEEYRTTTTKKNCSAPYTTIQRREEKEEGERYKEKQKQKNKNKQQKKRANIPNTLHNLLLAKQQWRPEG